MKIPLPIFIALILPVVLLPGPLLAAEQWVGKFDASESEHPRGWKLEHLDQRVPATQYRLRTWDGVVAVEAHAKKSMALLGRALEIDLKTTPILCWQWRIDAPLVSADMTRKSGDDYAARVYLTFEVPADQLSFGTRTKLGLARTLYGDQVPDAALNYIWDNRQPIDTLQDNAYTDRARMIVVRTGAAQAGQWVQERRNVQDDFRRAFGKLDGRLRGLAIASDTDNTGEEAHAGFADFRFVDKPDACPRSPDERSLQETQPAVAPSK